MFRFQVRFLGLLLAAAAAAPVARAQNVATFDDLSLAAQSYQNGANLNPSGSFQSGGASFNNSYNTTYGSWSGWSYSNVSNTTTAGYTNQYAAFSVQTPLGSGHNSANYAVAYCFNPGDAKIALPAGQRPESIQITNTTYAALAMLYGDTFSRQFGSPGGNVPDYFLLTITGLNAANQPTGVVNFYLADYRSANKYVVSNWTYVDLSSLGSNTTTLSFGLTSTDVGMYGMNTPAYFAADDLVMAPVPEPVGGGLLAAGGLFAWNRWKRRRRGDNSPTSIT